MKLFFDVAKSVDFAERCSCPKVVVTDKSVIKKIEIVLMKVIVLGCLLVFYCCCSPKLPTDVD